MVRSFLAGALVVLSVAAPASAATIASLYDTGVDAQGAVLTNGAAETHYTLVSGPAEAALRVATAANGFPILPWLGDDSVSAWVGPNTDAYLQGPAGTYVYQTNFDLTGFNLATVSIAGRWASDDQGVDILLNGVSTGITSTGFGQFAAFTIGSGFVEGVNTLEFVVRNETGPTGLRTEMVGTGDMISLRAEDVPEPTSLALLAAGGAVAGWARRRRR